jgi:hypothetical protein
MRTDHVPRQQALPCDQTVADKIQALLARCAQLRRGAALDRPTYFDRAVELHANSIATRDSQRGRSTKNQQRTNG